MSNAHPSYWAVVPAGVRYDKELPPNAKLLYAEISALTNADGYCFASNRFFEDHFGLSTASIQRLLKALEKRGYIRVEVIRKADTREVEERRIYAGINPVRDSVPPSPQKCGEGSPQKYEEPSPQKCGVDYYNNITNTPLTPQGGKEGKKDKLKLDDEARTMLNDYVRGDQQLAEAMLALMEVRAQLKAVNTPKAIKALLGRLDKLSGGRREEKIALLEQSVTNSWKSVFPLREGQRPDPGGGWAEDREVL